MLQPQVSILAGHTTSAPSETLIFTSQERHFPQFTACLLRVGVPIHATEWHRHCGTPAPWGRYTQGCPGWHRVIEVSLQNGSCSGNEQMSIPKHYVQSRDRSPCLLPYWSWILFCPPERQGST